LEILDSIPITNPSPWYYDLGKTASHLIGFVQLQPNTFVISNRKFIEPGDPNQNCQISMYSTSLLLGKETQKKLKLKQ